jgi:hypothetical protein
MRKVFRGGYATCVRCNKVLYSSRKDAKKQMKLRHPGAKGLNAYKCLYSEGWHFGNLPVGGREQARRIAESKRAHDAGS